MGAILEMGRSVAFLFTSGPYKNNSGREPLDLILSMSSLTSNIALFFLGDGVLQIMARQEAKYILSQECANMFSLLAQYDINLCYACENSLEKRGLLKSEKIVSVEVLGPPKLREKIKQFSRLISL